MEICDHNGQDILDIIAIMYNILRLVDYLTKCWANVCEGLFWVKLCIVRLSMEKSKTNKLFLTIKTFATVSQPF